MDSKDSVFMSADSYFPAESSRQPQPLSIGPLKPQHPPKTTSAHPSTNQSIFLFAIDRRFIISALICLFAFLIYTLPSLALDIFSFRKYLSSEGLV